MRFDADRLEADAKHAHAMLVQEMGQRDCLSGLIYVKRFIHEMRKQGNSHFVFRGQRMGYHVFPFVIDLILRYSPVSGAELRFNDDVLGWLIDKNVNFPEPAQYNLTKAERDRLVPECLIRMGFEQLSMQQMTRTIVPRIVYTYREIPQSAPERHRRFTAACELVFHRQFQVDLEDLLLSTAALSAMANKGDSFSDVRNSDIEWLRPQTESDVLPLVRGQLTQTPQEYSQRAEEYSTGEYALFRYERKAILDYPIIQFGNRSVVPDPIYLLSGLKRLTQDRIYRYFRDNGDLQEFAGLYGEVFKDYIGLLLRECFGIDSVFDLDTFSGLTGRRADWLVVKGKEACVFECKAAPYPDSLRTTGELDILEEIVDKEFGGALDQLDQTVGQWQAIVAEVPTAAGVQNTKKYLVVGEHFQFVNALSDFLPDNAVAKRFNPLDTEIIVVSDIETVLCSNYKDKFHDVFFGKRSEEECQMPLGQYVGRLPGYEYDEDNILDRKFREFFHMK